MDIITGLLSPILSIINKLIPDADLRTKVEFALKSQEVQAELQLILAQTTINANEASNTSIFVAGWRPLAGWTCAGVLVLGALIKVVLPAVLIVINSMMSVPVHELNTVIIQLNAIDIGYFITMLTGMLGLSGLRTFEKINGIETHRLDH